MPAIVGLKLSGVTVVVVVDPGVRVAFDASTDDMDVAAAATVLLLAAAAAAAAFFARPVNGGVGIGVGCMGVR